MGRPARTRTQTAQLDHHEHPTVTSGHDTLAAFRKAQRHVQAMNADNRARAQHNASEETDR